jgi:ribonuclease inhibitor
MGREDDVSESRRECVVIKLDQVASPQDLQLLLMNALEFPGWYGCNWNAFWDAITGLVEMPKVLRLAGWNTLSERLPNEAAMMKECLDEMAATYPESASRVEYV